MKINTIKKELTVVIHDCLCSASYNDPNWHNHEYKTNEKDNKVFITDNGDDNCALSVNIINGNRKKAYKDLYKLCVDSNFINYG